MAMQVCAGATLQCSFCTAPSKLVVTPENKVLTTTTAANTMDHKPVKNIPTFGMCTTQSNQAAATTAALGVYIPRPRVPVAPTVMIANLPALNNSSKPLCSYGGVISITEPGQTTVQTL